MFVAVHREPLGKRERILFQNTLSGETVLVIVGESSRLDHVLKELEVMYGDKFVIER